MYSCNSIFTLCLHVVEQKGLTVVEGLKDGFMYMFICFYISILQIGFLLLMLIIIQRILALYISKSFQKSTFLIIFLLRVQFVTISLFYHQLQHDSKSF